MYPKDKTQILFVEYLGCKINLVQLVQLNFIMERCEEDKRRVKLDNIKLVKTNRKHNC